MKKNSLINSKGISVIFLIIAMLLMVIIGYIFSYLIPSKQKSVVFPIQSTQAFFIAQSGVEFAVRYAQDNNWTTTTLLNNNLNIAPNNTRTLGAGRFTLTYTNVLPNLDTLISVGEVPTGTPRRSIQVSNFSSFLISGSLILSTPPNPCYRTTTYSVEFYIKNSGTTSVTLGSFSATWAQGNPTRHITNISIGSTNVFTGNYSSGSGTAAFDVSPYTYSVSPGQTLFVQVAFNNTVNNLSNWAFFFYSTSGQPFDFSWPLGGGPMGNCP